MTQEGPPFLDLLCASRRTSGVHLDMTRRGVVGAPPVRRPFPYIPCATRQEDKSDICHVTTYILYHTVRTYGHTQHSTTSVDRHVSLKQPTPAPGLAPTYHVVYSQCILGGESIYRSHELVAILEGIVGWESALFLHSHRQKVTLILSLTSTTLPGTH